MLDLLEEAPFDVSGLRARLDAVRHLPNEDVGDALRLANAQLDRAELSLSLIDLEPLPPHEIAAHQRAIDWLATARAIVRAHAVN